MASALELGCAEETAMAGAIELLNIPSYDTNIAAPTSVDLEVLFLYSGSFE